MSSCCVTDYYTGAGGDNRPSFAMEIKFNKEEIIETNIFVDFSIREYVAEIRKKDPEKCWPFGSLRDPDNKVASLYYQSPESTLLSGQSWPSNINSSDDTKELTDAPNLFKVEHINGKEDRHETTTGVTESLEIDSYKGKAVYGSSELTFRKVNNDQTTHEINVDEDAKTRHNEAADNIEPGRNRPRRKHKKYRLLTDIYKDPASKLQARYDRPKTENVNRKFVADIEDESDDDDVTLAVYFKKQKGVEITDLTLTKKRSLTAVEEPSVDLDKKSNHGSVDSIGKDLNAGTSRKKCRTDDVKSQIIPDHKKDIRLQCNQTSNQLAEVSSKEATETEKENEDPEMEAVMLLARHFNDQKQILNTLDTKPTCACVKKKIQERTPHSSNTATKHRVKKITNKKVQNPSATKHRAAKKINKKKLESAFSSVQMSFVCSVNRNPADFSIPNGENVFMRGG